ncbi:hypothetical protein N7448_006726 [Penicillium atrosanguineum]|uniref:Uncharacterized protein n=1 Tax=Penicillium atrosanguineum TaxID=1132637 RepID=A0A9W9U1U0_9EURO|nr:uncharacterized protein N7443_010487 [Penicillium atrosanguineum]KAJ5132568.1 hypothetical protein N7448_006726 [Penicillium atrosanguineum]KAJ5290234.1 hypothetical protein N7443_010487 [Penicillium atrosanguineum]KAJ5308058.1 hypothetical protein N7476_008714 [Penicillium atrosanguineum]
MAQHHEHTSVWWPEERIKATLDTKFIVSRLRPEHVPKLFDLPEWGEGLSSETYMEWILLKAGRLFLILDAIAIPDRIFALVDESRDDDDLPFAEPHIDMLNLSPNGNDAALDSRFFQTQWRFLVRGITEGEHVTYTGNEGVPVEIVRSITNGGVQGRDDTVDKVILAGSVSRMFMRTQVQVGGAPHFFSSEEVLAEVKKLRRLAHRHLVSLYASYFVDDTICALFTGAETDRSLHSFVTDEPPSFKRLAKEERRQTLITWPHCLVSALSWLHSRGYAHAAIRPSNILIDPEFNIYLGQFQALDSLLAPPKLNDLESYNYSAPERWVRIAAPVQPAAAPSRTMLPSGGRTARRRKPEKGLSPLSENSPTSPDFSRPESAASSASKGTVIRIGLPGSPSRFSFAFSSSSSSTASSGQSEVDSAKQQRLSIWKKPRKMLSTPSLSSAYSSSSGSSASSMTPPASSSSNPTVLNTWKSRQSDNSTPSDLFSLAAIILDILTHMCKRSQSSFTSHRSARNRSAGRGGGMADASFHLSRNSVQVQSWIALLEGDALKRCRRDRGSDRYFYAIPRMLIVLRAMLAPEPEKRPNARRVEKCFANAIREIPMLHGEEVPLHCVNPEKEEARRKREEEREAKKERVREAERERLEELRKNKAETILSSSSVSEFDFGFSAGGSDSETEEDKESDAESMIIPVDQVSPQLSLPNLDLHLSGIEGLSVRD